MDETLALDRVPPQSVDAEQGVLGSMMLEKDALSKAAEILKPEFFYRDAHRIIYSALLELAERNEPTDLITVVEELQKQNKLEQAGGRSYISALINSVPMAANVEHYARIVEQKALLRSVIYAATQMAAWAYRGEEEATDLLDQCGKLIFDLSRKSTREFHNMKDVTREAFSVVERRYKTGGITGISTGFPDLDQATSGFQESNLIVLAGRTSMGKTSLALNMVQHVAIREGKPVAIFSLEMSRDELALRMLCSEAQVNGHLIRTGGLQEADWKKLVHGCGVLEKVPIFIDDSFMLTPLELRSKARRLKSEVDIQLLVVDYLQQMIPNKLSGNRVQDISDITRSLKSLARELQIPVVALSQLSRAIEKRDEKVPMLSDLRESGSIEQDADVVMFIHRKSLYSRQKEEIPEDIEDSNEKQSKIERQATLYIAKQRNGPTKEIPLVFMGEYATFVSKDTSHKYGLETIDNED